MITLRYSPESDEARSATSIALRVMAGGDSEAGGFVIGAERRR
jgi:hypothetical protein